MTSAFVLCEGDIFQRFIPGKLLNKQTCKIVIKTTSSEENQLMDLLQKPYQKFYFE